MRIFPFTSAWLSWELYLCKAEIYFSHSAATWCGYIFPLQRTVLTALLLYPDLWKMRRDAGLMRTLTWLLWNISPTLTKKRLWADLSYTATGCRRQVKFKKKLNRLDATEWCSSYNCIRVIISAHHFVKLISNKFLLWLSEVSSATKLIAVMPGMLF